MLGQEQVLAFYPTPKKNLCENKTTVAAVSVFTLIRTDTTLDLSQKA